MGVSGKHSIEDRPHLDFSPLSEDQVTQTSDLFSYEVNNNSRAIFASDMIPNIIRNPESFSHRFGLAEYAVFISVLVCSAAIGLFYGFINKGQGTTDDYLMGSRKMSTIPVALSLLCSFVSAITVLGNPVEIYFYGSTYGLIVVSFIPMTLSLAYCYVPVYHNLQLSSAYEYLELRFSRSVRVLASLLGICQYVFYMAVVVYGPGMALSQVTGIPTRLTTSLIFSVCIFYSTLGGLKAVLWTDSLQAVILVGSLAAIVTKGIVDTGGFDVVWNIATEGNRTKFFNFDPDIRTRHTVWSSLIGGYMMWTANFAATHSQVQRYLSIPTILKIRRALFLNFIGLIAIFGLCYLAGLVLYARYYTCDPLQTKAVQSPDQLLPFFVMETLGEYPGFPGLFVAGITCASLSSVSSGLNSLSAIMTYDYVKQWFPNLSDVTLLRLSKSFCVIFGGLSFGFVFVVENLGNILPITFSICGGIIGAILGLFTLGMFFPWANSKGALLALVSTVGIMLSLILTTQLSTLAKNHIVNQKLPGLTVDGCSDFDYYHHNQTFHANSTADLPKPSVLRSSPRFLSGVPDVVPIEEEDTLKEATFSPTFSEQILIFCARISYMWYPCISCTLSVLLGLTFSFLLRALGCVKSRGVNPDYLSHPALSLLTKLLPNHTPKWIEADGYPMLASGGGCSFSLTVRSDFSFNKESMCDMKLKRLSVF